MGNNNTVITASHSYIQPHADGQWTVDVCRTITTWLWQHPEMWTRKINAGDLKDVLVIESIPFSYLTISNDCPGIGWKDGAALKFHKIIDEEDSGHTLFVIVGYPSNQSESVKNTI
jgi:hypothetical protein